MYSLVLLSPRYVAVFLLLSSIGLFAMVRLPRSAIRQRLAWAVSIGMLVMIGLRLAPLTRHWWKSGADNAIPARTGPGRSPRDCDNSGQRTATRSPVIGYGPPAYWARLAHVRIVAEMFSEEPEFCLRAESRRGPAAGWRFQARSAASVCRHRGEVPDRVETTGRGRSTWMAGTRREYAMVRVSPDAVSRAADTRDLSAIHQLRP